MKGSDYSTLEHKQHPNAEGASAALKTLSPIFEHEP